MADFLTLGEPMVVFATDDLDQSLIAATHFTKFLAGAELNVAVGISRLNHTAHYVSAVGNDPFGSYILHQMQTNSIQTTNIVCDPNHWTGFYLKEKVSHGDPDTYYFRKNSAAANLSEKVINSIDLTAIQLAHLSGIYAALSSQSLTSLKRLITRLHKRRIPISFDPNLRPSLWQDQATMITTTNELAKNAQLILPGINEGEILVGSTDPNEIADFYLSQSDTTQAVIVKLGPRGAYVKTKDGLNQFVSGFPVEHVVDTVGAGDGFAVGVLTGLLDHLSIIKAAQLGCAIGALAVQSAGDSTGYPTRTQLTQFLSHYEKEFTR
ncbi:sugar kinase [Levilactobacillus brevis]|jgi:2-dehydro-3-deoxygluconokinase|uniref:2-dehydro-3-deoxygluconokinase n=1 Tax=Levilactobacillus brevis (strain ATCC 367 / BCRC 12310 / CIP 105137 / JCM 1170 / LMG 11437 / NCIMB 947 / NCTC 947) TaxID=387344 RepID=Q03TI1_LEVBA|nr:sugar kinase [Levilactobacillus brevis]ABJ63491.1 2-dehydro-3-deoxygluconokinase [Levilactobacillus brevis ATCC 367]KWT51731.1 2-dehydro-3-deoxygluconokinase [Levilactobacillus brevis]KWU39314.1 2-dehydro-3-deoxygluconokinase [Levilactobacillus brevis]MCB4355769.1 sugar kinase [Levilactobacillus brevis]MCS6162795.1 sugar kinase [Levilactobacillus brevis]